MFVVSEVILIAVTFVHVTNQISLGSQKWLMLFMTVAVLCHSVMCHRVLCHRGDIQLTSRHTAGGRAAPSEYVIGFAVYF